jgi:hypothetical protein
MNKVYLDFVPNNETIESLKIVYFGKGCSEDQKEECNVHLYYFAKENTDVNISNVFESASNPKVHTILHIDPTELEFYQKNGLKNSTKELVEKGVHIVESNNLEDSIDLVNSIAREF